MKSYVQLTEFLGSKESRPVGNNTRVHHVTETVPDASGEHPRINRGVAIRLHQTDVVTIWENGCVVLNSGGWQTSTTKDRINSHGPVTIWQKNGVWSFQWAGKSYLFADGVTIHPDGTVTGAQSPSAADEAKKLRKQIAAFAKLAGESVPLARPGAGDCLICQCQTLDGKEFGGTDHFTSHMEEGYVVPSLVYKAMVFAGYNPQRNIQFSMAFDRDANGLGKDAVSRSVKKYMLRQFGLA